MSWLPITPPENVSAETKQIFEFLNKNWGFVPNYCQALGHAPQLLQDLLLFGVELGRYDDRDRLANHLARLIAEDACGAAVPREDATFERLADDRIVR